MLITVALSKIVNQQVLHSVHVLIELSFRCTLTGYVDPSGPPVGGLRQRWKSSLQARCFSTITQVMRWISSTVCDICQQELRMAILE